MNKICVKCNVEKAETCFSWRNKAKQIRTGHCKECQKLYDESYLKKDKKRFYERKRLRNQVRKERINDYIIEWLEKHPCVSCGEDDIVVLDFDHLGNKTSNVSLMIAKISSIKTIKNEIKKCQVLCANCHRRKTAKENGSYRLKINRSVSP